MNIRFIYTFYALSIVIIIGISTFLFYQLQLLTDYSNKVIDTHEVKSLLSNLQQELVQAENNQLDYLVRQSDSLLLGERVVLEKVMNIVNRLEPLVTDDKKQEADFIKLKSAVSDRFLAMHEVWRKAELGTEVNYDRFFLKGARAMESFRDLAERLELKENEQLIQSENEKTRSENITPIVLYAVLGITCIFQLLSFRFIIREFKTRHHYQTQLEENIKDLKVTNAELEQIAFVTSHDLQEPLRKIRTFSDRLLQKHNDQFNEDASLLLQKINVESGRVQGLMADLVNYSTMLQSDADTELVDLNMCVENAIATLQPVVKQKKAIINKEDLPIVNGNYKQLNLLFYNLLDNAMKFGLKKVAPVININHACISSEEASNEIGEITSHSFHRISVSDNGIGFDDEYAHKIFFIFQRLHTQNSPYTGKGIGLAISKRVAMNHSGFIIASGTPGTGATFHIYLPQNS